MTLRSSIEILAIESDREHYHGELAYRSDPVGDTTRASISVALAWNTDGSIGVDYTATIQIHTDAADHETHHLNVLRDRSEEVNVHLRSGGVVPDHARIRLALVNRQQAR